MHMAKQVRRETKATERKLVAAHFDIDVHGHRHGWLALFGLVADDHRVIRNLDRGRWQLAYSDRAFGHLYLAGHRQLVIDQAQGQVRGDFQRRIGLDRDGQLLALQTQVHAQCLAPGEVAIQLAAARLATAPTAIELYLLAGNQCLQ